MTETSTKKVLIIVENLPVPFDRRVWSEATALQQRGYEVSVICPTSEKHSKPFELLEGIHIYRHPLPQETGGVLAYLKEYAVALFWEFRLSLKVRRERGFHLIQICNPPDLLFLVALWHKVFSGTRIIFDHHDVNPELYENKYKRRDLFYYGLRLAEFATFRLADVVISTNESYRDIALRRGKKQPERVFIVRSSPDPGSFKRLPSNKKYNQGKRFLVGYVGVMGEQDGVDYLLEAIHYIVHKKARRDTFFQLIGDGPSYTYLQTLAEQLGITEYIEFTGFLTGNVLLERLSSSTLCVSPDPKNSFNDVCTMNKILEYMTLGKASVQFDLVEGKRSAQGAALYAKDNSATDFAEKILHLLDNPSLRHQLECNGKERMNNELSWTQQVDQLMLAYDRALP